MSLEDFLLHWARIAEKAGALRMEIADGEEEPVIYKIRCENGDCPILAVFRDVDAEFVRTNHYSNQHAHLSGLLIDLDPQDTTDIILAADGHPVTARQHEISRRLYAAFEGEDAP